MSLLGHNNWSQTVCKVRGSVEIPVQTCHRAYEEPRACGPGIQSCESARREQSLTGMVTVCDGLLTKDNYDSIGVCPVLTDTTR